MLIFMAIRMKLATCHVRNEFERPLRPNAPTARVLTSVILKGIEWAFRKLFPTKIPGMVHQGLLAPQRLVGLTCKVIGSTCKNAVVGLTCKVIGSTCKNTVLGLTCKVIGLTCKNAVVGLTCKVIGLTCKNAVVGLTCKVIGLTCKDIVV